MAALYLLHKSQGIGFLGKEGDRYLPPESFIGYLNDGTPIIINYDEEYETTFQSIDGDEVVNHYLDVDVDGFYVTEKTLRLFRPAFLYASPKLEGLSEDELVKLFGVKYE